MDKTCFVIGPIGDEGSPIRRHADWILDGIVNRALDKAGLPRGVRADRITTPGMIDSQVIIKVLEADLVIADLTTQNPNAFYELGLRHMAEKPIIHLIHRSELKSIPFDVLPYRTVPVSWDTPTEVLKSIEELHQHIQAAISAEHVVENPVTKARGRQQLRMTASPPEKLLIEEMQSLSTRVAQLERSSTSKVYTNLDQVYTNIATVTLDQVNRRTQNFIPVNTSNAPPGTLGQVFGGARNLDGKRAVFVRADADATVIVEADGQQFRLPSEQWEKLPLWAGLLSS